MKNGVNVWVVAFFLAVVVCASGVMTPFFASVFRADAPPRPVIQFCLGGSQEVPDVQIVRIHSEHEVHLVTGFVVDRGWVCTLPYVGERDHALGFRGEYRIHVVSGAAVNAVEVRYFSADGRIRRQNIPRDSVSVNTWRVRVDIPPPSSNIVTISPSSGDPTMLGR